jgi:nucleoid DNA-binding protein
MPRNQQEKISKDELITYIANLADTSKSEVNRVLIALSRGIHKYLREGKQVPLQDLGIFRGTKTKAGMYYNALIGKEEFRDEKIKPSFKPSLTLKEVVNKKD